MKNFACRWTLAALLSLTACGGSNPEGSEHEAHDDRGHHGEIAAAETGPRNGRLLADGGFVVELAIFEAGVPPEYRAWVAQDGEPVSPHAVKLTVELSRLDGEKDLFRFAPQEDFLRGDGVVAEPHSFDVTVVAEHAGKSHRWTYDSYEGRVRIAAESAKAAGVVMDNAGPRLIRDVLPLYGRVTANPDAIREVGARFPGVIKSVAKSVGDPVKAGEVLARVESNDSLQIYAVTAPIAGTLTARAANPGEQAAAAPLFTVSDLSQLWAELSVFPRDLARVRVGQEVRLTAVDGERSGNGHVVRIAPAGGDPGSSLKVWASLAGSDGAWTPGLYISAEVLVGGVEVPLAVKTRGLQAFRDSTVVFTRVGETYEVRMLELGRSDGEYTEVLAGLKPGAPYVAENSYLIKADIEKSGASHEH